MKEQENTKTIADAIPSVKEGSLDSIEQQKLDRDIKLAELRQKQRLDQRAKAPNVKVSAYIENGRADMARRLVPEAFVHEQVKHAPGVAKKPISDYKKGSTMTTAYAAPTDADHKKMLAQGWIPVKDEFGAHATEPNGDRLYKRDICFEKDEMARISQLNRDAIEGVGEEVKKADPLPNHASIKEDITIMSKK